MATKRTNLIFVSPCLVFSLFFICLSQAITDTIIQGQQFKDSDQLFSSNGYFKLEFLTLGDLGNRYLGISYNQPTSSFYINKIEDVESDRFPKGRYIYKDSEIKPVWVANRNNPISGQTGTLIIDKYGNMKIFITTGNFVLLNSVKEPVNASATLLDTGNFVLRELNLDGTIKRVLWQSFDYPTNTLLPGMKLGINHKTGLTWSLTSWKSADDPGLGSFTLGGNPNGTKNLNIWWNGKNIWSSGFWNNGKFELVPKIYNNDYQSFNYISNENETYFAYFVNATEYTFPIITIDSTGVVRGTEGSTIIDNCITSYNSVGGCVMVQLPKCRDKNIRLYQDTFFIYGDGYKFPESENLNQFDCMGKCLNNCSCRAFAPINDDGTGCQVWNQYSKAASDIYSNHEYGRRIFLFYTTTESVYVDYKKNHWTMWLIIAAAVGVPVIFMLYSLLLFIRRQRILIEKMKENILVFVAVMKKWAVGVGIVIKYHVANIMRKNEISKKMGKLNKDGKKSPDLQFFTFISLASATNNFSPRNEVGKGGFGPVYKGKLPNGLEIAIKRLSRNSKQGVKEFMNELTLIARLQHTNLVRLVGCCIQRKELMLIYEYMPNKSLDFFLFDPIRKKTLDWEKRFAIIEGIAQGLLYLHKYSRLRMIHRDLKAGNILLDENMNPKISDFGMARIFEHNESKANTNRVAGTYGYMSPEYAMEGICSMKSDVFSFGVMLLEIISGTKNNSYYQPEHPLNLTGHAWELWKEGKWLELMDPSLKDSYNHNQVLRCTQVGLLCVQDNPADRPTMSDVAAMIIYDAISLAAPKQPAFFIHKTLQSALQVEHRLEIYSTNSVSMSQMVAR